MLTDEQARRFCVCERCNGFGSVCDSGNLDDSSCPSCSGSGIDPAKRTKLEELLREKSFDAWEQGFDASHIKPNPYAKAPTNG